MLGQFNEFSRRRDPILINAVAFHIKQRPIGRMLPALPSGRFLRLPKARRRACGRVASRIDSATCRLPFLIVPAVPAIDGRCGPGGPMAAVIWHFIAISLPHFPPSGCVFFNFRVFSAGMASGEFQLPALRREWRQLAQVALTFAASE